MDIIKLIDNLIPLRRTVIDENVLHFLVINSRVLKKKLIMYGYYPFFFKKKPLPDSCPQNYSQTASMSDAITYMVCNKLECQKKEIGFWDGAESELSKAKLYANWNLMRACRLIERTKPSSVLFAQGYTMESAALRSICIENGIPFIAVENTCRKDRMLWDNCSGITVNRNLSPNFFWRFQDHTSNKEVNAYHDKYIADQKSFKTAEHSSPSSTYTAPDNKPLLTWIGQVYTDSSVLFGLKDGFVTPIECINVLLSFAYEQQVRVFIKMHPKECGGKNIFNTPYNQLTSRRIREYLSTSALLERLGDRVLIDHTNKFDTYSVIEKSSLVATVNSQAGLESAIRGIPVILCGKAFYGGLGFTWEAASKEELYSKICNCCNSKMHLEDIEKARRFNYIFFEKYCRSKTVYSLARLVTQSSQHRIY